MQQPHILLITSDQHRGDCLGINGHPVVSAPNLDYLAASGTNFPRAYVEGPSCIAARRTILSGQKPVTHGMVTYRDGVPWEIEHTLPGELGRSGYQTQLVGKLHMHPPRKRYGFDHMVWANSPRGENDYTSWLHDSGIEAVAPGIAHGLDSNSWVARPSHLPEELEHTTWCTNEAMRFLGPPRSLGTLLSLCVVLCAPSAAHAAPVLLRPLPFAAHTRTGRRRLGGPI